MSNPILVQPGPIPGACITSAGELDAMITGALPVAPNGWVWTSATAPDVVTYTIYKRWIWVDLTDPAKPIKRCWNSTMSSWDAELPADGSITGAMLADHTIGLIKLDVTGGSPLYVLRINNAGTSVEYTDPQNLFDATHRLPVDHLALSSAGSYLLTSDGTTNVWATKASFFAGVTYAINQIDTTGAVSPTVLSYVGTTLAYRTVVAATADNTLPVTKLVPDGALYLPRTNAAGTAVEWASPSQIYNSIAQYISTGYTTQSASYQAISAPVTLTFAHGLGVVPSRFGAWIVCITAEYGYVAGDRVNIPLSTTGGTFAFYEVGANSTQIKVAISQLPIRIAPGLDITPANWKVGCWANI